MTLGSVRHIHTHTHIHTPRLPPPPPPVTLTVLLFNADLMCEEDNPKLFFYWQEGSVFCTVTRSDLTPLLKHNNTVAFPWQQLCFGRSFLQPQRPSTGPDLARLKVNACAAKVSGAKREFRTSGCRVTARWESGGHLATRGVDEATKASRCRWATPRLQPCVVLWTVLLEDLGL